MSILDYYYYDAIAAVLCTELRSRCYCVRLYHSYRTGAPMRTHPDNVFYILRLSGCQLFSKNCIRLAIQHECVACVCYDFGIPWNYEGAVFPYSSPGFPDELYDLIGSALPQPAPSFPARYWNRLYSWFCSSKLPAYLSAPIAGRRI